MPRYFVPLSREEFETKLVKIIKKYLGKDYDDESNRELLKCYGDKILDGDETIYKDLRKVGFDLENFESYIDKHYETEFPPFDIAPKVTGYNIYSNGLTAWGMHAGGDWENPVFFIIYFDGRKLRGYVPKDGNLWNTDTNWAYGNEEDEDAKNIKKRFNIEAGESEEIWDVLNNLSYNVDEIEQDIINRIQPKP